MVDFDNFSATRRARLQLAAILVGVAAAAHAQSLPPLTVEIDPDHPLFIFNTTTPILDAPADPAAKMQMIWSSLPDALRPYSVLEIEAPGLDPLDRRRRFRTILEALQESGIPAVIHLTGTGPADVFPLEMVEELVRDFGCVKGVLAEGLSFNEYYEFGGGELLGLPPNVRWLVGLLDIVPRYGRFVAIRLNGLDGPRLMSSAWTKALCAAMREAAPYVVPITGHEGAHYIPIMTSLMGLWLEGIADQWGLAPTSEWYSHSRLVEPGVFGQSRGPGSMPPALYRAMILNGAMTGATVYQFPRAADLWFGPGIEQRPMWEEAIYPTLIDLLEKGLIARQGLVRKKAKVAYQLAPSRSPLDFHLNLRDIDPVFDQGYLIHGAYGVERAGQVPELILNSGRHYWVPVLSPYAPADALQSFAQVVRPGVMNSAQGWTELLDRYYQPDGMGTAFMCRVGRGVFVMNTRENLYEEQTFRLPDVPAPVRGLEARREEKGISLSWPFREGDVAYKVHKRVLPEERFVVVANDVVGRQWFDPEVDPQATVAYAVTALTNEEEPYEGTVNYGDYLTLSAVESRIAEEVLVGPLLGYATSRPIETPSDLRPKQQTWWPNLEGLTEAERAVAEVIAKRVELWDRAFSEEDLETVLDLYMTDYEDSQGWRFQYVRRAYQWFFERYDACKMHRQIRRWILEPGPGKEAFERVKVLLYCRFTGVAISDPTGRFADMVAFFPRTDTGEVWVTFSNREGAWRISRTEPALPNFADILSFSAGPYDTLAPGPDLYSR